MRYEYKVRYVHKISPRETDTAPNVTLDAHICTETEGCNRVTVLGKALRDAGLLNKGERLRRDTRIELTDKGHKLIAFPQASIWHCIILEKVGVVLEPVDEIETAEFYGEGKPKGKFSADRSHRAMRDIESNAFYAAQRAVKESWSHGSWLDRVSAIRNSEGYKRLLQRDQLQLFGFFNALYQGLDWQTVYAHKIQGVWYVVDHTGRLDTPDVDHPGQCLQAFQGSYGEIIDGVRNTPTANKVLWRHTGLPWSLEKPIDQDLPGGQTLSQEKLDAVNA